MAPRCPPAGELGRAGVTEPSAVIERKEEMNNERSSEFHDESDRRSFLEQALAILMTTCARRWRVPSSAEEMLSQTSGSESAARQALIFI
jgi:hypothetical protein